LLVFGQFFEKSFEGGIGEPGDKVHAFGLKDDQFDFAAHTSVENKHGLGHGKTTTQDFQQALQGGRRSYPCSGILWLEQILATFRGIFTD